jgi:hypothetical protein
MTVHSERPSGLKYVVRAPEMPAAAGVKAIAKMFAFPL